MPKPAKNVVTLFVIHRLPWEFNDEEYFSTEEPEEEAEEPKAFSSSDAIPLQSFLSRARAQEQCLLLEQKERGSLNPFECGGDGTDLTDYSTLTLWDFRHRLHVARIRPPRLDGRGRTDGRESLLEWFWNLVKLTPEQRDVIWYALDRVRLLEVVEMEVELEA